MNVMYISNEGLLYKCFCRIIIKPLISLHCSAPYVSIVLHHSSVQLHHSSVQFCTIRQFSSVPIVSSVLHHSLVTVLHHSSIQFCTIHQLVFCTICWRPFWAICLCYSTILHQFMLPMRIHFVNYLTASL